MTRDNKSLGKFILDGIPPAPRGVPQVEVTFDIDANGILHVSATDKATNKSQAMQIIPSSGLSDSEIERMVRDAEQHASEDARRKESVEAANMADNAVYSAEKMIRENGDKISDAVKSRINHEIEAVKSARGSEDASTINAAVERLQQALQEAGAAMYQAGGPTAGDPAGPAGPSGASGDEDVIEGEFS